MGVSALNGPQMFCWVGRRPNQRHGVFSKIARSVSIAIFAIGAANGSAQTTSWVDGTGDWFNSLNWSAGVPNSGTVAYINNGGTAQLSSNGGNIGGVLLGLNTADSGTLTISGAGNISTDNTTEIGRNGTGVLEITNGGDLTDGRFVMGAESGSHGTATVSGTGSTWTNTVVCFVGYLGTARLNILAGGQVLGSTSTSIGESTGSNGTVIVDGAGSAWTGGSLTIAGNGTGYLSISNGAQVSSSGAEVARNPGSNGTVNVSGGSTWMNNGPLSIANGFAVTTGAVHIMSGSAVSATYSIIGGAGGTGTATVDGAGSTWTNSGDLFVGSDQGYGTLTITQGGTVSNSRGYIGFNGFGSGQSVGRVTVDGTGSRWTNNGNLYVGGSESGAGGFGALRIENGGTVSASATTVWSAGAIEIGANHNLLGSLTFAGGKLRSFANTTFVNDAALGSGGIVVDSNSFDSTLTGTFSGTGSLTKIAPGTTSLSGSNTYVGGTTVDGGTLLINNTTGSGTGTGAVQVISGTLGGTGTIAGAVTIGSGSGSGAVISPGTSAGTQTIQSALMLNSDATYKFELNSSTGMADKIVANGITINGATFSFTDLGAESLAPGMMFVIIDNASISPTAGTFSNLANNSTFTNNGNTYRVSYEGGSGNDLTVTVVPEPATWGIVAWGSLVLFVLGRRCTQVNSRAKIGSG